MHPRDDAPAQAAAWADSPPLAGHARRLMWFEIIALFSVSLGASGVRSLVSLIGSLTEREALSAQHVVMNGSQAPGRPWFDLSLQLVSIATGVAPAVLAFYLLARNGERPSSIGVDATQPGRDLLRGAGLAALIGGGGLALYYAAFQAGISLNIVAASLPDIWWRFPVLLLSAAQNAISEEVIMIGYLLTRLDRLGMRPSRAIVLSAVIRGSYHLYQGAGAFLGNAVMGLIFGYFFRRWGRVMPMIIAHFLIDAVTFVGYALLAGHVSWLPKP